MNQAKPATRQRPGEWIRSSADSRSRRCALSLLRAAFAVVRMCAGALCSGLRHIFARFRGAVVPRSVAVINLSGGVDPHETRASTWGRSLRCCGCTFGWSLRTGSWSGRFRRRSGVLGWRGGGGFCGSACGKPGRDSFMPLASARFAGRLGIRSIFAFARSPGGRACRRLRDQGAGNENQAHHDRIQKSVSQESILPA